jgi:hypothetical protein
LLLVIAAIALLPASPGRAIDAGFALAFDGNNDFVVLHETGQMMHADWQNTKTVSLWVKPTARTACEQPDPALCKVIFGDRPKFWGITIGDLNGQDKIWVWNYDGNQDRVGVDYTLNTWVHITMVHAGGMLSVYRNGFLVGSTASGTTLQPNTGGQPVLYLGGMVIDTTSWGFTGELDEVRLWNYARSASEIQQDLLVELSGDETGLLAYYRMSDGSGSTLTDDGINTSWDGTLHDGDANVPPDGSPPEWVTSGAFDTPIGTPTPTGTPTNTPTPTVTGSTIPAPTSTSTATPTPTLTGSPSPTATTETNPAGRYIYINLPVFRNGEA